MWTHVDIRSTNLTWRWVDRIDANDFREYNWKENSWVQGSLETTLGDMVGDKALGGSYDVHINIYDRLMYNLTINSSGKVLERLKYYP